MQVAGLPVELSPPDNPEISIQAKRSYSKEKQLDGTRGKSQGRQTTTSTHTPTPPRTSPSTIIPAPSTFIMTPSSSPGTIIPSTITTFTTKAITQTIPNPASLVISSSSSSLPPKPTTDKTSFLFNPLSNTTVCGSLNITWEYNGQPVVVMTLVVQNQVDAVSGPMVRAQPPESVTFRTLISDIPSNMDVYLWAPVDIDEGWYTAKAFDTGGLLGISAQSAPFFVDQTQLHPPCPMANNTISSTNTTDSSGHPVLHAPEIVGITLGGIAGSVALSVLLVFIVPRFWRKELPDPKARRPRLLY